MLHYLHAGIKIFQKWNSSCNYLKLPFTSCHTYSLSTFIRTNGSKRYFCYNTIFSSSRSHSCQSCRAVEKGMVIGNLQSFENCIYWDIVFPFSDRPVNH